MNKILNALYLDYKREERLKIPFWKKAIAMIILSFVAIFIVHAVEYFTGFYNFYFGWIFAAVLIFVIYHRMHQTIWKIFGKRKKIDLNSTATINNMRKR